MKNKISACLVVYNEEKNIKQCLDSLVGAVDEIVIVHDGRCQDQTLEICRRYTDKIFVRQHIGEAEPHRSFSFRQATGEWVLQIDADEFLTPGLNSAIRGLVEDDAIDGYDFLWHLFNDDGSAYAVPKNYKAVLYRKSSLYFLGIPHFSLKSRGRTVESSLVLGHLVAPVTFAQVLEKRAGWARLQAEFLVKDFSELESFQATREDWCRAFSQTKKYGKIIFLPLAFLKKFILGKFRSGLSIKEALWEGIYSALLIYYYQKARRLQK